MFLNLGRTTFQVCYQSLNKSRCIRKKLGCFEKHAFMYMYVSKHMCVLLSTVHTTNVVCLKFGRGIPHTGMNKVANNRL